MAAESCNVAAESSSLIRATTHKSAAGVWCGGKHWGGVTRKRESHTGALYSGQRATAKLDSKSH